ncbi:MAG: formate/nitrite transporter family protein [Chloroflexota bacterium]|nr:formate/nitrite transporter family protein [Chloroflexota bacterium]
MEDGGEAVALEQRNRHDQDEQPPGGYRPAEIDAEPKPLGQEAPEVIDDAAKIGARRLHRGLGGTAITAFIGGMSIGFGVVAMAWAGGSVGGSLAAPSLAHLTGSLAFPTGFLILLIGKSELFTENFFLPVAGVLMRRGSLRQLVTLWTVSLGANLVGSLLFAFLISRPGVLDTSPATGILELATTLAGYPFWTALVKALFAGWLMTALAWMLIAAEGIGARLVLIWVIATLVVLAGFNNVVISAAQMFIAMFLGAPITVGDWLTANFLPALLGNVIGGVVFVTLLHYVQAQYQQSQG